MQLCIGNAQRVHKNFPGLGHVTPTIFHSTVGYPSDSLASCCPTVRSYKQDSVVDTFMHSRQHYSICLSVDL